MGCGIWLFSRWYLGCKLKTMAGSGIFNYERERDFMFWWGWDARFARGTGWDLGFQFLRDFINWPTQKPQTGTNKPSVRIAKALYPVKSCLSKNVSIIAYPALVSDRMRSVSESYCDLLSWPLTSVNFRQFAWFNLLWVVWPVRPYLLVVIVVIYRTKSSTL